MGYFDVLDRDVEDQAAHVWWHPWWRGCSAELRRAAVLADPNTTGSVCSRHVQTLMRLMADRTTDRDAFLMNVANVLFAPNSECILPDDGMVVLPSRMIPLPVRTRFLDREWCVALYIALRAHADQRHDIRLPAGLVQGMENGFQVIMTWGRDSYLRAFWRAFWISVVDCSDAADRQTRVDEMKQRLDVMGLRTEHEHELAEVLVEAYNLLPETGTSRRDLVRFFGRRIDRYRAVPSVMTLWVDMTTIHPEWRST